MFKSQWFKAKNGIKKYYSLWINLGMKKCYWRDILCSWQINNGVKPYQELRCDLTIYTSEEFTQFMLYFMITTVVFPHQWHLIPVPGDIFSIVNSKNPRERCVANVPGQIWSHDLKSFTITLCYRCNNCSLLPNSSCYLKCLPLIAPLGLSFSHHAQFFLFINQDHIDFSPTISEVQGIGV